MTVVSGYSRASLAYPSARICGQLVTRLEERPIASTVLDATNAEALGREHIGWFVGDYSGAVRAARQFARIDNWDGGIWVVVPLSREMSMELFEAWPHRAHVVQPPTATHHAWRSRKVWFATPEALKLIAPLAHETEFGVAGIAIVDPPCMIYKSRSGVDNDGRSFVNDRPQHVVNFRTSLDHDGWQPPLLLLTSKPAKSVNTEIVARAFCLNAFRFIAGDSFGCWDRPIDEESEDFPILVPSARTHPK